VTSVRRRKSSLAAAFVLWLFTIGPTALAAQGQQANAAAPPKTPRAAAPVDLTGYWVSVVTEDWRWRMVTPPVGDTSSLPLNKEGLSAAKSWNPAKDAAEPCRAYGAAGIMRLPIRLQVSWQNETTLKMDIDNGRQTRLFRFDRLAQPPGEPQWQGISIADWETVAQGQGLAPAVPAAGGAQGPGLNPAALSGSLKVVTTRLKPGYLRRNGVPYSEKTVLTEFFDRTDEANGDSWLILTSIVDDPTYLDVPLMLSTHFKREPDGAKFNQRPCEVIPPVVGAAQ
jgi:hypothetical protein